MWLAEQLLLDVSIQKCNGPSRGILIFLEANEQLMKQFCYFKVNLMLRDANVNILAVVNNTSSINIWTSSNNDFRYFFFILQQAFFIYHSVYDTRGFCFLQSTPPSTIQMNCDNKNAPKVKGKCKNVYISRDSVQPQAAAAKKITQKAITYVWHYNSEHLLQLCTFKIILMYLNLFLFVDILISWTWL